MAVGASVKVILRCSECKERNYFTVKNKKNTPDRLEMKKYCPPPLPQLHCPQRDQVGRFERSKQMDEENKSTAPVKVSTNAVKKNEGKLPFGKRVAKWFREMRSEARKVIWPTPKQTLNNTAVALGMMVVSALVLWGFDTLAKLGVQTLIDLV